MSWRMHIAVVNTQKAQDIRMKPGAYYTNLQKDWPEVQKILCNACNEALRVGHLATDLINAVEDDLKANGLTYNKRMLTERFHEMSYGPFEVENNECFDFTCFHKMVENDMGVIEDYTLGRFDISKDIGAPFFVDAEAQDMFDYYNPRIILKKDLEGIVELWRKIIVEHYKEILLDPAKELIWRGHIEAKIDQWESPYSEPYNLSEKSKEIVRAYDLEYRIFDLVRLYKAIDWQQDTVVFFGW